MTFAAPFIEALTGKPIAHVWRGAGSAVIFEFGTLQLAKRRRGGSLREPEGQVSLMIEWSWRIERARSILCGSWSSERRWPGAFKALVGAEVRSVEFVGALPEICLSLSNNHRISSFMTAEGQPSWAVIAKRPAGGSLCVKGGRLNVEAAG
jgi:hypothetical protein